jgi:hypothetical protein
MVGGRGGRKEWTNWAGTKQLPSKLLINLTYGLGLCSEFFSRVYALGRSLRFAYTWTSREDLLRCLILMIRIMYGVSH